jgi:hypothetical protein
VTTTTPAAWLAVQTDLIPQCLRDVAHWVVWRAEFVKDKWTKVPYRAAAPDQYAAVDDPSTWSSFATALESYTRVETLDGIGYVLTGADAITGVDLDHCRDPETGTIGPWAQTIVARFSTYTELSPSATGLRLFMFGTLPPGRRVRSKVGPQQAGKIEVYDDRRFFTVTGHQVVGTSMQLEERRDELARWHAELFPPAPAPADRQRNGTPPDADDASLLEQARRAANGAKFSALYDRGDVNDYGSPSEADAALCWMLAFWTKKDAARIDRLFRGSALMREKWDAGRGAQTYGARTVAAAITQCTETYTPRVEVAGPEPRGLTEREWPTLASEALYGLAGRIVAAIDPHTEADPVATLATFLVSVGNLLGPGPHAQASEDPHPGRLYAALVGESAKGRKGMSWRPVRRVLDAVDPTWGRMQIASGLSSGEGVIYHVRDPREERQPVKERNRVVGYETVVVDHGVEDKRLLVEEPELASVLRRMDRESNSLSAVLRQAWDDGHLGTLTKHSPLRATGAHVSLLAHVTEPELLANLGATERVNGFANRFLYLLVRRSKELPDPSPLPATVLGALAQELTAVVTWAQTVGRLTRDLAAEEAWRAIYSTLSAARPGLLGAITNRAEAHTLRLSVVYALLDRSAVIRREHLEAGLAFWGYAETSARLIFGDRLGDPIADTIEAALRARGPLTRTELRDLFHRNLSEARLEAALRLLVAAGRIRRGTRETGGRPAETWEAT